MEVKPKEGDNKSNPTEGDEGINKYFESEKEEDDSKSELTDEEKESALAAYNKATGKNYKTFDAIVERDKQTDIVFAKKEVKVEPKKESQTTVPQNMEERLLKVEEPLTKYVMEEMRIVATNTGKSLDEIWNDDSGYFKGKAQALNEKKDAAKRIGAPSGTISDDTEELSFEKKMSQKFMKNFPPGMGPRKK